ncbi:Callose synthase 5 [Blastocladiella emersonii ATCC 22665]|nr:Callose synthase 5 [Blastocladiella emersonii ATCC 22665]
MTAPPSRNDVDSGLGGHTGSATPAMDWREELRDLAAYLVQRFGFQPASVANQVALITSILLSRSSRAVSDAAALADVHREYVSGPHANYAQWVRSPSVAAALFSQASSAPTAPAAAAPPGDDGAPALTPTTRAEAHLASLQPETQSSTRLLAQVLLWLSIWGEAANLRFCPEFLAFTFHAALLDLLHGDASPSPDAAGGRPSFLADVVRPTYLVLRNASFKDPKARDQPRAAATTSAAPATRARHRDHEDIVGYDDWNECFQNGDWLRRLKTRKDVALLECAPHTWYSQLADVPWEKYACKTFLEKRTFQHVLVNFARVWTLHLGAFITLLPPVVLDAYFPGDKGGPPPVFSKFAPSLGRGELRLALFGLGGLFAAGLQFLVAFLELKFLPWSATAISRAIRKATLVSALGLVNLIIPLLFGILVAPPVLTPLQRGLGAVLGASGLLRYALGLAQVYLSWRTCWALATRPVFFVSGAQLNHANPSFTAQFPARSWSDRRLARALWIGILALKLLTGYYFLILPLGEPVRIVLQNACHIDDAAARAATKATGAPLGAVASVLACQAYGPFVAAVLVGLAYIFFHLDTYLWYTIATSLVGFSLSVVDGASLFRPWQGIFSRLPDRIHAKVLDTGAVHVPDMAAVATVWNRVVDSLYRGYHLSREQYLAMLYRTTRRVHAAGAVAITVAPDDAFPSSSSSSSVVAPGPGGATTADAPAAAVLVPPNYFITHEDRSAVLPDSEADRRLRFFARSLSMRTIPAPMTVRATPAFTVLVPHYAETVLLSVRDLVREGGIMQLQYLQALYPDDWDQFLAAAHLAAETEPDADGGVGAGAGLFADEDGVASLAGASTGVGGGAGSSSASCRTPLTRLPPAAAAALSRSAGSLVRGRVHRTLGYQAAHPAAVLRTRLWASARTQTLYRTVAGIMQYREALELLASLEASPEAAHRAFRAAVPDHHAAGGDLGPDAAPPVDEDVKRLVDTKFGLVVAMQQYARMSPEERADLAVLTRAYTKRGLRIAYIDVQAGGSGTEVGSAPPRYYSVLLGHHDPFAPLGEGLGEKAGVDGDEGDDVRELYRIELPGPPILGDGKSDNQNTALIYQRGEVVQLMDANQDHYLEEALKLRSALAEFARHSAASAAATESPLAIVGAREFIFSESVGLLGNIAAGKEYTFGTLTQRVMARLQSRMHYGHPDYLHFVFMSTRGGIAKAQRGLHLNEDIYAGMTATMRGGRIAHHEYVQCGKGRDLGFASILQFTGKIGGGMAEQLISREHYYLGTQLPVDWLLTFYYAHPGFHLNNVLSMVAIRVFALAACLLAWYFPTDAACARDPPASRMCPAVAGRDHALLVAWLRQSLLAFTVYFVSYLPFLLQLVTEHGVVPAVRRLVHQVVSLAPVFETMVAQVYAHTLVQGLRGKLARYAATGRRVATARTPMREWWAAYHGVATDLGLFLCTLVVAAAARLPADAAAPMAFVVAIAFSLVVAPMAFNPHMFDPRRVARDYWDTVAWLFGTGPGAWYATAHVPARSLATGHRTAFAVPWTVRVRSVLAAWLLLAVLVWRLSATVPMRATLAVVGAALAPWPVAMAAHVAAIPWVLIVGTLLRCPRASRIAAPVVHVLCAVAVFLSWTAAAALAAAAGTAADAPLVAVLVAAQTYAAMSRTLTQLISLGSRETGSPGDADAWWAGTWTATHSVRDALVHGAVRGTAAKVLVEGVARGVAATCVHLVTALFVVPVSAAMRAQGDHWHTYHMLLWGCPTCGDKKRHGGEGHAAERVPPVPRAAVVALAGASAVVYLAVAGVVVVGCDVAGIGRLVARVVAGVVPAV